MITKVLCFLTLALMLGCTADSSKKDEGTAFKTLEVSAEDGKLYEKAAKEIIALMSDEIKAEMLNVVKYKPIEEAIEICQYIAPSIAEKYSKDGWKISRISDRNRNPYNRADSVELTIMTQLADSASLPFVGKWESDDSVATYLYYQPIRTQRICLKCHGDVGTFKPELKEKLQKNYPDDLATGYDVDQLRGLFVVRANWPQGTEYAKSLTTETQE